MFDGGDPRRPRPHRVWRAVVISVRKVSSPNTAKCNGDEDCENVVAYEVIDIQLNRGRNRDFDLCVKCARRLERGLEQVLRGAMA